MKVKKMSMANGVYNYIFTLVMLIAMVKYSPSHAQTPVNDSISNELQIQQKYDNFYDSLKFKAQKKKVTRLIHNLLITGYKPKVEKKTNTPDSYTTMQGKTIGEIRIVPLEVFGTSLKDTLRKAKTWFEKTANSLHTKSNLRSLQKNLLIDVGDTINAEMLYENERILRLLPYIRDVRFIIQPDALNDNLVHLILLTQDRFSIGATGSVNGFQSAAAEIYNRNFLGIGHEISLRVIGHLQKSPYAGIETFYKINNVRGKFLTFAAGYMNSYINEGAMLLFDKDFLRTTDKWGYGVSGYWFDRTSQIPGEHFPKLPIPLQFVQGNAWVGRNFQLKFSKEGFSQLTFSTQFFFRDFKTRPITEKPEEQFFYNATSYLAGITWSQRDYSRDLLVHSYGITEDIPKGFKNEMVLGIENHELGPRLYSHLYLSNGNWLGNKPEYFYTMLSFGSYFRNWEIEQGLAEMNMRYISRLLVTGKARFRQFVSFDYKLGINRIPFENLYFEKNNLIRGFRSKSVVGKQRLSANFETVYFQKRSVYKFNLAFFTFVDLGIVGPQGSNIFTQTYYSGIGIGMRIHNESLVLKTFQLRLAFYPNHPEDVDLVGFMFSEQARQNFYSFQPSAPTPRKFE